MVSSTNGNAGLVSSKTEASPVSIQWFFHGSLQRGGKSMLPPELCNDSPNPGAITPSAIERLKIPNPLLNGSEYLGVVWQH